MLLTIDVGNTNVVFAVFNAEAKVGEWRCATEPKRTADEYAVWLSQLMALRGIGPRDIDGAVVASVVPAATFNIRRLCTDHFGCAPTVIGEPGVDLGLRVVMEHPEDAGADRLVNAVAATASYASPLIVVDFGTATTFDVVNSNGDYLGGVIAPGINLSLEALIMAAAKLPRVDIVQPARVIGGGTVTAMQSGIFWGYIGLIEGLVSRIKAEFSELEPGREMTVVGTGGLAVLFAKATDVIQHTDSDLTLRGLRLIYEHNRSK